MKVLMFSSDPRVDPELRNDWSIPDQNNANWRIQQYRKILDKLEIVKFDRIEGRFMRFLRGYNKAKNLLSEEKFDLISAQEIEHSLIAWLLSKKFAIFWQMQIHTDIFSPYYWKESFLNKVRVLLAKFLIPRATCIRVVSKRIKDSLDLRHKKNTLKISVLPIFYPFISLGGSMREKYTGYDFYILMMGRLSHEKNYLLALDAMKEVIKQYPKTLLVIVGDGPERKIIEQTISNGLKNNICLEGWQENLSQYYQFSDLYLLTSNYEGYSMSTLDAAKSHIPVIMTDVGIAGDIIKDGNNGIVVPVGDKTKLVKGILTFIKNTNFRNNLIKNSQNPTLPYESFEDYLRLYKESLEQCLKK